jgi:hypothetical protein
VTVETAEFRTCPHTRLKVETVTQVLIKANVVAAVVFLAIYILFLQLIVVGTVLHGEKIRVGNQLIFPLHLGGATASQYGSDGTTKLLVAIILVAIFSTCFASSYFINWKYLSELWLIW